MAPLRRDWEKIHATLDAEVVKRDTDIESWQARTDRTATAKSTQIQTIRTVSAGRINALVQPFLEKIRTIRVLDPACGSGNFLYMSLRQLLDLEKEVINAGAASGTSSQTPQVNPAQLFGIEVNDYAHELAQATVWIGWIQWLHENGYGFPSEPILKRLDNIMNMDAILAFDAEGKPVEPEWPEAEVIVGNPPFLGNRKMIQELGEHYAFSLRNLYQPRVNGTSDLVCYWFDKARSLVAISQTIRVGLIATNSIRDGFNRPTLEKIKATGDIFMAWSDRPWILDGAAVRVSLVGFDNGSETERTLDGKLVKSIRGVKSNGTKTYAKGD
jgi:type II restriction/modification system DNA methylase subunit YeeA